MVGAVSPEPMIARIRGSVIGPSSARRERGLLHEPTGTVERAPGPGLRAAIELARTHHRPVLAEELPGSVHLAVQHPAGRLHGARRVAVRDGSGSGWSTPCRSVSQPAARGLLRRPPDGRADARPWPHGRVEPLRDHRVVFDFEVDFSNGGGIQGQDFRLDIDGDAISDEALAAYIVRDMRLLIVGEVRIVAKRIIARAPQACRERRRRTHERPTHRPQPRDRRRHGDLSRSTCTRDHRPPVTRSVANPYADGFEFQIGRIEMVANTGTYMDTPFHRFADGYDLARLPLGRVAGPGRTRRSTPAPSGGGGVAARGIPMWNRRPCCLWTGWDRHWGTERYGDTSHPSCRRCRRAPRRPRRGAGRHRLAQHRRHRRRPSGRSTPSCSRAGIPIVEHLSTPRGPVPPRVPVLRRAGQGQHLGTFPVRCFALLG